jgi:3-oxoacyl-[acyl-carrier protein] reductase
MVFDLNGTRILITGAGSPLGIGFASARLLADMGAVLYLTGASDRVLQRVAELRTEGVNVEGSATDLTDEDHCADLVAAAVSHLGGLDVLVNNAGMTSVEHPMHESGEAGDGVTITPEGWRRSLDRNLNSAFYVTRAALPHLRASGRGRIIMMSSVTGPVMAIRSDIAYATTKAAMVGLTKALAVDEAPRGITVNAIAPGWIATTSQLDAEVGHGAATPMGRSATPEEVAAAVAWLATREASYITGQVIVVDGGNSIAEERN